MCLNNFILKIKTKNFTKGIIIIIVVVNRDSGAVSEDEVVHMMVPHVRMPNDVMNLHLAAR